MDIGSAFPSNYLKASDFAKPTEMVMDSVQMEEVGDDTKPVLYFQRCKKGLVLNKTNSNAIQAAYGKETDDWSNKKIVVYPSTTDYQGKTVDCLRIKVPKPGKPAAKPAEPEESDLGIEEEKVPF